MIHHKRWHRIMADVRGAALIEFALVVPLLITFLWGIVQVGLIYQSNAGMQHALGEAARHATLYVAANNGPPTDAQISARVDARKFGLGGGKLEPLSIDRSQIGSGYMTLSLTFTRPTNFLFFEGPDITLTRTKRVYVAA